MFALYSLVEAYTTILAYKTTNLNCNFLWAKSFRRPSIGLAAKRLLKTSATNPAVQMAMSQAHFLQLESAYHGEHMIEKHLKKKAIEKDLVKLLSKKGWREKLPTYEKNFMNRFTL